MKARHVLPLAGFLIVAAMLGRGLKLEPRKAPSPLIDQPAPSFSLPSLHDATRAVSDVDLRGQPWVLNVWASWCAPCREEHPVFVAASKEGGVPLVGLNYKDDPRAAQEWLRRLGDPYVGSAVDRDGRVGIDYGVYGVPETFVIDKDGVVRFKHIGPMTTEIWQRDVLPLMRKLQS